VGLVLGMVRSGGNNLGGWTRKGVDAKSNCALQQYNHVSAIQTFLNTRISKIIFWCVFECWKGLYWESAVMCMDLHEGMARKWQWDGSFFCHYSTFGTGD